jgi:hypothetical protein
VRLIQSRGDEGLSDREIHTLLLLALAENEGLVELDMSNRPFMNDNFSKSTYESIVPVEREKRSRIHLITCRMASRTILICRQKGPQSSGPILCRSFLPRISTAYPFLSDFLTQIFHLFCQLMIAHRKVSLRWCSHQVHKRSSHRRLSHRLVMN